MVKHTKTMRRQTASDVVLEFLLLTLNIFHTFLYSFYCYFEQVNVSWEYHSRYLLAKHQQWKHQNDVWSEVCLKLTIKTPERATDFTNHCGVSVVNFEQVNTGWVSWHYGNKRIAVNAAGSTLSLICTSSLPNKPLKKIKIYEICSKLTINALEKHQWLCSSVFIVNFELTLNHFLLFLLLTFNM